MILLDTSGMLSALDAAEPRHAASVTALRAAGAPRLLSPFVLAELDYLLATRVSPRIARAFLGEVAGGAYELAPFDADDVARAAEILDRHADLALGLADASIVVLAERRDVLDVLTLDERHFRVLRGPRGRPFRLLPADR
ncbi:MAG TPA: PIN domain-containing protein [Candidatus Limnocylindrales bacterium]